MCPEQEEATSRSASSKPDADVKVLKSFGQAANMKTQLHFEGGGVLKASAYAECTILLRQSVLPDLSNSQDSFG